MVGLVGIILIEMERSIREKQRTLPDVENISCPNQIHSRNIPETKLIN